jgi:hypothetical protein
LCEGTNREKDKGHRCKRRAFVIPQGVFYLGCRSTPHKRDNCSFTLISGFPVCRFARFHKVLCRVEGIGVCIMVTLTILHTLYYAWWPTSDANIFCFSCSPRKGITWIAMSVVLLQKLITTQIVVKLGARIAQSVQRLAMVLEGSEFESRYGQISRLSTSFRPVLGSTQPPIQYVPGLKLQGREADHSPPSSAEVNNCGAIPPLPIFLRGIVLNYFSTGTAFPFFFTIFNRTQFTEAL